MEYLSNLAMKYNKIAPLSKSNVLEMSGYSNFTAKNQSLEHSRIWSELRSSPTKGSIYSTSVRNNRFKAMGLNEETKNEYFKNLKIINKLQFEKKKREKIIRYFNK